MKLMKFLKSSAGRKFYNFAYCWGACLVILGAVFKIAHMPFDSILLMVGLFTEVFIFFISGFDTPEDIYQWEKVFPELKKDGISGKDLQESLDNARRQYTEKIKDIEAQMDLLGKTYHEHSERMKAATDAINPASLEEMQKQTDEMTRLLRELNSKYGRMLEIMNSKQN